MFVYLLFTLMLMTDNVSARSEPICDSPVDIAFVVDTSSSIGPQNFIKQINFIHDVVQMINIGPGSSQSRVAVVSFSSSVIPEFGFSKYQTEVDVLSAIDNIKFVSGLSTRTYLGLQFVHESLFAPGNGERPAIKNVVVLTDGQTNPGRNPVSGDEGKRLTQEEASKIQNLPAYVFAIGVGNKVDKDEIHGISSKPSDSFSIFVDSYNRLDTSVIKHTVLESVCNVVQPPVPPRTTPHGRSIDQKCSNTKADVFFVVDTSSSLRLFANVQKEFNFVAEVIGAFEIKSDQVRTGMMTFSDEPEMLFQLDEFKTKDEIQRILRDMTADFWKGGQTYIDKALRLLMDEGLSTSHGSRTGVPQIAVIITDGKATDPAAFEKVVQQLQRTNYIVFAKGVGPERNPDELSKIASDASHIFQVEDVDSLEAIRKELLIEICVIRDRPSPPSPVEECKGAQGDLIFVADSSRSIGHEAFDQLKKFAMEVVKRFTISPQDMQVGFIVFGNDTDFEFKLNTYRDQDEVINAISKVKYLQGMQLTYTDKALTLLTRTGFTNQNGGRGGKIPKIAVVITDGVPRNAEATRAIANKAKQQGIIVFAIGVGPYINQATLDIMASDPTEFHSFLVSNHDALSSIEDELAEKTCTAADKRKQQYSGYA